MSKPNIDPEIVSVIYRMRELAWRYQADILESMKPRTERFLHFFTFRIIPIRPVYKQAQVDTLVVLANVLQRRLITKEVRGETTHAEERR